MEEQEYKKAEEEKALDEIKKYLLNIEGYEESSNEFQRILKDCQKTFRRITSKPFQRDIEKMQMAGKAGFTESDREVAKSIER